MTALHHPAPAPNRLVWLVILFALIIQQNAFLLLPLMFSGHFARGVVNPVNTAAVTLSLASILIVCAWRARQTVSLLRRNVSSVLFMIIVLLSAVWSIHPDLTFRRGTGYMLTILVAVTLLVYFDLDQRMKLLSCSFAVTAVGSVLFVALFPEYGIMQEPSLIGNWRGVFPHKNVMGPIMAVAVFTELFILVHAHCRRRFHVPLLALFLSLVILSGSATALMLSVFYLLGAGLYVLWRRRPLAALIAVISCVAVLVIALVAVWNDPGAALALFGKDLTLSGRMSLWSVVMSFIRERPLLGWGYHAMWEPGDPTTTFADKWSKLIAGNAENSFLSITLELGLLGLSLILVIIGEAMRRSLTCCRKGLLPLGWLSAWYFVGTIMAAQTTELIGKNQVVAWVVFNVLTFSCGLELASLARAREPFRPPTGYRYAPVYSTSGSAPPRETTLLPGSER